MRSTRRPRASDVTVWLLLAASLLLVAGLRFNDQRELADSAHYADAVRRFRGQPTILPATAPFVHRPLVPLLASALPLDPMTALNVVNLACLEAGLAALWVTLRRVTRRRGHAVLCAALFVVSFPTFYYGAIGYVDPAVIACLAVLVLGLVIDSAGLVLAALAVGMLAKEVMAVALPAAVAAFLVGTRRPRLVLAAVACAVVPWVAVRQAIPFDAARIQPFDLGWIAANLTRPRAWASLGLTFGLPGILTTALWMSRERRHDVLRQRWTVPLVAGALSCLSLAAASWVFAYTDGRFLWPLYPFCLPLAGGLLGSAAAGAASKTK